MKSRRLKEITTPENLKLRMNTIKMVLQIEECTPLPPATSGNISPNSERSDGCRFKIRVVDTLSWFKAKMTFVRISVLLDTRLRFQAF